MAKKAAKTSIMPMALAAVEQYFPEEQRILDDNLAYKMLPLGARLFTRFLKPAVVRNKMIGWSEKSQKGIWGGLLCRKRYIDEKLVESNPKVEAIVNMGAGFDTRVYRLSKLPVWELDQLENIETKRKRLVKIFGKVPDNVKLSAIDLDYEEIATVLASQGYSLTKKTLFVWEAVTQYLTEQGIKSTFDFLSKASTGSRLLFTYVKKDFFDGKEMYGWESGYKRFVLNKIWLSAFEPSEVSDFLKKYEWKIIEDKGYNEMAGKYIAPTQRNLTSTPVERVVYAEKI